MKPNIAQDYVIDSKKMIPVAAILDSSAFQKNVRLTLFYHGHMLHMIAWFNIFLKELDLFTFLYNKNFTTDKLFVS